MANVKRLYELKPKRPFPPYSSAHPVSRLILLCSGVNWFLVLKWVKLVVNDIMEKVLLSSSDQVLEFQFIFI